MRFLITSMIFSLLVLVPFPLPAQVKTDVEMGSPSMQKFVEIESQISQDLPDLLRFLQEVGGQIQKGRVQEAKESLQKGQAELESIKKVMSRERYYDDLQEAINKIEGYLNRSLDALNRGNRKVASTQISAAYRYSKALADSPTMKLTAAMISLDLADQQIRGRNYSSAGTFLNRAINYLGQIEDSPQVNYIEIKKLKNEIVIAHQQVTLGKMADDKKLKTIYNKMDIANTNTLYNYYDMWARTEVPWMEY